MDILLRIFILICGLVSVGSIIYLVMKRKLSERNSLFWIVGAVIIFAISAAPEILQVTADLVGVDYPPALLYLFSILVLLFISLNQSIQISLLNEQLKELTQKVAIHEFNQKLYEQYETMAQAASTRENTGKAE